MIRVAIVGTGIWAGAHAKAYSGMSDVKLAACCDVDEEKARRFAARFGFKTHYSRLEEMLDEERLDAASVVTSDAHHVPVSLELIKRGIHVLCEKPIAGSARDARRAVRAVRKAGLTNMVNFWPLRTAAARRARKMVEAGTFGSIRHFECSYLQDWLVHDRWGDWRDTPALLWRLSKKHGSAGALGDLGSHVMALISFVLGDCTEVSCKLKTFPKGVRSPFKGYTLDANDSAVLGLGLRCGAAGTLHMTRWATGQANSVRLRAYGTRGAFEIDLDRSSDKLRVCSVRDLAAGGSRANGWKTMDCGRGVDLYREFIKAARAGRQVMPDFDFAARVQQVLDSSFESDAKGGTVRVR